MIGDMSTCEAYIGKFVGSLTLFYEKSIVRWYILSDAKDTTNFFYISLTN